MIRIDDAAQVHVIAPFYTQEATIQKFIHQKADWIQKRVDEISEARKNFPNKFFADGDEFLFLGKNFPIKIVESEKPAIDLIFDDQKWKALVPCRLPPAQRAIRIKERFFTWYRLQAEEILGSRVFHYSRLMGVCPKDISIRNQKRIWGSCCYRKQRIHLNWRIVMSPLEVLDYVVVHELCHLKVPNHSRRFWQSVEKILPGYRDCRQWLKVHQREMTLPSGKAHENRR